MVKIFRLAQLFFVNTVDKDIWKLKQRDTWLHSTTLLRIINLLYKKLFKLKFCLLILFIHVLYFYYLTVIGRHVINRNMWPYKSC